MGQFSWLDCRDRDEQILCNVFDRVYMLIPSEFGGGHHCETWYEGYGVFDGHDVYEEVARWNRSTLTPDVIREPHRYSWPDGEKYDEYFANAVERYNTACDRIMDFVAGTSDEEMKARYGDDWLREIGIDIACEDNDNRNLKYPIKITHDRHAVYENCGPSDSDPNQG